MPWRYIVEGFIANQICHQLLVTFRNTAGNQSVQHILHLFFGKCPAVQQDLTQRKYLAVGHLCLLNLFQVVSFLHIIVIDGIDKATMFPAASSRDQRFFKTLDTKAGPWKALRRGGFFGPNGSGKSSFIESLAFARGFIVNGQKSGKGTGVNQFKGHFSDLNDISTFQFLFFLNGDVYEYGFALDRRQVHEEWLMILTQSDMVPMFTRVTDENGMTRIDIESRFARKNSKERRLAEILKDSVQENQKNQLFLYKLYDNGIKKAEMILNWFRNLQIIFPDSTVKGLPLRLQQDNDFKTFIAESLKKLDTGVLNLNVASDEFDFYEFAEKMELPNEIIEEIEEIKTGIVSLNGKYFIFLENEKSRTVMIQIKFEHRLNEKAVSFNMEDESDGTQRLLDLLPILFTIKENNHMIFFVDEIDRSLHTRLSQYLLSEFAADSDDTYNQIIFTAHDVNLINLEKFRQDEIWFVEKNQFGESQLKPLSDFNIQKGQDTLKAYLSGRFGAIPVIKGGIRNAAMTGSAFLFPENRTCHGCILTPSPSPPDPAP